MLSLSPNYDSTIKCCVIFNFLDEVFMKHRPIAHPQYISHDFRRIRCYPRSTPTFFIPIHSRIAWLWLATAPCLFYIVKATIVSFLLMLRDLLILPFSSTSTLLPSFVKHAQTAKKQVCWHLYIYFMRLFIFMELPSFVKDADGFNINLTGFLYTVVNSSPNKATTASFRLDQELIYLILC